MDYSDKVKIYNKINKVIDNDILKQIFKIAKNDLNQSNNKYTKNNNGIFFDLLLLSDIAVKEIDNLLTTYFSETETETCIEFVNLTIQDKIDNIQGSNDGPRLSNHEKNIILKNDNLK